MTRKPSSSPPLLDIDTIAQAELQAAARRALANQGWGLVDDWDTFMAEVAQALTIGRPRVGDSPAKRAERAVTRAYCVRLLAACRERHGRRAAQAFDELGRYLHAVARARCRDRDIARDAAQRALEIVWRHLDDVRDPWAFLGYARVVLVRELDPRCRPQPGALRFAPLRGDDADEPGVTLADPQADEERADAERSAQSASLRRALADCLRSPAQRQVVERLFLQEQSVVQVADALGTTPANVWVLKSRALDRLRQCPEVMRALGE